MQLLPALQEGCFKDGTESQKYVLVGMAYLGACLSLVMLMLALQNVFKFLY